MQAYILQRHFMFKKCHWNSNRTEFNRFLSFGIIESSLALKLQKKIFREHTDVWTDNIFDR